MYETNTPRQCDIVSNDFFLIFFFIILTILDSVEHDLLQLLLLDRGAVKSKVQKQSNGDRLSQQNILLKYNPAITSEGIATFNIT